MKPRTNTINSFARRAAMTLLLAVMTVADGTRAPLIPGNAIVSRREQYGSNVIITYRRA